VGREKSTVLFVKEGARKEARNRVVENSAGPPVAFGYVRKMQKSGVEAGLKNARSSYSTVT